MLKEEARLVNKINIAVDVTALLVAFWLAYIIRGRLGGLGNIDDYAWVLLIIIPAWTYLLHHYGFYSSRRFTTFLEQFYGLLKVHLIGGILTSSVIYLIEPKGFSRGFFLAFLCLSFSILGLEQIITRLLLRLMRLRGYNYRNILLVGTSQTAMKMVEMVEQHKSWGLRIVGVIQPEEGRLLRDFRGHRVLGTLDELINVCKANPVDEVIFGTSREEAQFKIEDYIRDLEEMGITARTVLTLYAKFRSRTEVSLFNGEVPLMTFYPTAFNAEQLFLKRCLDIVGGAAGLAGTAILFPFIAIALKLESPGPIFFGQTRVGENGRKFTCWKFRSMFPDAEELKKDLLHLNEMNGAIFKIENDPRVTKCGRFLRKTSLDEFPQFWNVLKGEMSLVGTRPPTPEEVDGYENWQRKRICVKPGITGLWQVSGRNQIKDFNEVVRLDLDYISRWSIGLDIKLLFMTVKVVLLREGSC